MTAPVLERLPQYRAKLARPLGHSDQFKVSLRVEKNTPPLQGQGTSLSRPDHPKRLVVRRLQGRVYARGSSLLLSLDHYRLRHITSGSSASCTTTWASSTISALASNVPQIPSVLKCQPCLRYKT